MERVNYRQDLGGSSLFLDYSPWVHFSHEVLLVFTLMKEHYFQGEATGQAQLGRTRPSPWSYPLAAVIDATSTEQTWVVCSFPFPHNTMMEETRKNTEQQWKQTEKNKCSFDVLTGKMLMYGYSGLTEHDDERQAGKQHQLRLNTCFLPWSQRSPAGCQLCQHTPTNAEGIALPLVWSEKMLAGGQGILRAAGRSCLCPFPIQRTPACGGGGRVLVSHLHKDSPHFLRMM